VVNSGPTETQKTPRLDVTVSPHNRQPTRPLTPQQEAAIRAHAGTKSLRALAAEFGVSHETVRIVRNAAGQT
jgi:DNA-binding NarL/FixJ family response regulator